MSPSLNSETFELLRRTRRRRPDRLATLALGAVILALALVAVAWWDLRGARLDSAAQSARADAAQLDLRIGADAAAGRADAERQSQLQPRAQLARRLDEIERCHPERSRLRGLVVDTGLGTASLDTTVPSAMTLDDWLACLNEGSGRIAWRLVRVASDDRSPDRLRVAVVAEQVSPER